MVSWRRIPQRATAGLNRIRERSLGSLVRVRTPDSVAALTFDDGPDPETTPQYLDLLSHHGARATFFMLGEHAARHPGLVRRVYDEGHAIGNHTWDHPRLPELSWRDTRRQIERCAAALAPYGRKLFRPPYTLQSLGSFWMARSLGYEVVAWCAHTDDWLQRSPERMRADLVERIKPGAILLLHDAVRGGRGPDRAHDREAALIALDDALTGLGETMRFLTVPELMRAGRPVRRPWFVKDDSEW